MFLSTLCFPHVQATSYTYARKHGRHVRSKQISIASFKILFKWALCLKPLGDKKCIPPCAMRLFLHDQKPWSIWNQITLDDAMEAKSWREQDFDYADSYNPLQEV